MTENFLDIICLTYNQEKYISKTIESFLKQKTKFEFKIIIHDDSSSDNTREIILKYKNAFPNKIECIFQNENQYSKGKRILPIPLKISNAKYIALCEGDDYWIDENKLQTQIDALEKNKDCDLCFHSAYELIGNKKGKLLGKHGNGNKIFSINDIIIGDGGFCPTASLVFRRKAIDKLPDFFDKLPVGDYFLQILGAINGGALYIDKPMSIYRINSNGSWSESMENIEKKEKFLFSMIDGIDLMNNFLDNKYFNAFTYIKSMKMIEISDLYFNVGNIEKYKLFLYKSYKTNKSKDIKYIVFYYFKKYRYLYKIYKFIKNIIGKHL